MPGYLYVFISRETGTDTAAVKTFATNSRVEIMKSEWYNKIQTERGGELWKRHMQ